MPERSGRKRNLWILGPGARPLNLGLRRQPPPEATWWCLEGDAEWKPMPAGYNTQITRARPSPPRRGKPAPAPGQGTLWKADSAEPCLIPSPHGTGQSLGDAPAARPILRWPGGKSYLLPRIRSLLAGFPCQDYDYLEPMIGGGAVYWAFGPRFRTRVIGDKGGDLVTLYRILRNDVERLITELQSGGYEYRGKSDPASVATFRRLMHSEPTDPLLRAARYLYLNRSCWGGMMRTVRGRLKASPNSIGARICDPGRLRACAAALQGTTILRGSAHSVIAQARAAHPSRQFLLLVDPPYDDPAKKFREYSGTFTRRDQAELVESVLASGYKFIYTNKATEFILSLFAGAAVERITLPLRHKLGSKGPLETELLVHNLTAGPVRD